MPNQTKEELMRIIQQRDETIAELKQQLKEKEATLRGTGEPGWLVKTKNTKYSGTMFGIYFEGGRAFVPKSHHNAEKIVGTFVNDFDYEVEEIDSKEFERGRSKQKPEEPSLLEKISQPTVMNK